MKRTMKTMEIPVEHVEIGMIVLEAGYQWKVKANVYDATGNAVYGQAPMPRRVLVCDAINSESLGYYATDMSFGRMIGAKMLVQCDTRATNDQMARGLK